MIRTESTGSGKHWQRPWPALQQRGLVLRRYAHQQLRDNLLAF